MAETVFQITKIVMRKMLPTPDGQSFSINLNETINIPQTIELDPIWDADSLKIVVFVQSVASKIVYQSETIIYSDLNITGVDNESSISFNYALAQNYPNPFQPKHWIDTIAWRKALDRRASLRRWCLAARAGRSEGCEPWNAVEHLPAGRPNHEEEFLGSELASHIRRLVGSLPAKLRDPLLLVGSGDYTYEEAAAVLGVPVGTVKWRVSEARRRLKRRLARLGYGDD